MCTLLSKLACVGLFANFFLAMALIGDVEALAQNLPGSYRTSLPDASGKTLIADYTSLCNPALLVDLDSAIAAVVVTPSRFGMPELACSDILAAWNTNSVAYGFAISGTGSSLYNELSAKGFFALTPTQDFAVGVGLAVYRLGIRDSPAHIALYADIGIRLRLAQELTTGIALHNVTRSGLGGNSLIDQAALLSAGLQLSPDVAASTGVLVQPGAPSSFLLAASCTAASSVQLRLGFQTFPRSAEGGIAWSFSSFTITGTMHYHSDLGFSQTVGCLYRW